MQQVTPQIPMKAIEASRFPHGIVITDSYLKISNSIAYTVSLDIYSAAPLTIGNRTADDAATMATGGGSEIGDDTNITVDPGEVVAVDLASSDDINWAQVCIEWYEPTS